MNRRRAWGAAALFCWVVALFLVVAPVGVDEADCGRPVAEAFGDSRCAEPSRDRLGKVSVWVVFTAPVTVLYLAQPPRRRDDE